jgi:hypothetical protein
MASGVRERPVLAPACHASEDESRIALKTFFWPQAEALHHAGPEPFDDYVSLIYQLFNRVDALGIL